MKLTGETITDDQIRQLMADGVTDPEIRRVGLIALRSPNKRKRRRLRARAATIWNHLHEDRA